MNIKLQFNDNVNGSNVVFNRSLNWNHNILFTSLNQIRNLTYFKNRMIVKLVQGGNRDTFVFEIKQRKWIN